MPESKRSDPDFKTIADFRRVNGKEILACEASGITAYIPKTQTSGNRAKGLFDKQGFIYKPEDGEYECPAVERPIYRFTTEEKGTVERTFAIVALHSLAPTSLRKS